MTLILASFVSPAAAQFPPLEIPRPPQYPTESMRRDALRRLEDQQLRTEITGNRFSRQTEVARLESRVEQLEQRLRSLARRVRSPDLQAVMGLLDNAPQSAADEDPAAAGEDPAGGANLAAPRQQQLAQLMVADYLLALQIDLLEAHGDSLRATDQLRVLERFVAKGQATAGQLELQQLKQRQAALQETRLQRQLQGLQRILPPEILPPELIEAPLTDAVASP